MNPGNKIICTPKEIINELERQEKEKKYYKELYIKVNGIFKDLKKKLLPVHQNNNQEREKERIHLVSLIKEFIFDNHNCNFQILEARCRDIIKGELIYKKKQYNQEIYNTLLSFEDNGHSTIFQKK